MASRGWIGIALAATGLMPLAATAQTPAATEIETAGPQGPLKGAMIDAGRGAPVVVIIPGSGPTDRDGNSAMGFRPASYRLLAEALGAQGISSIRIDKRGMFTSKAAIADPNAVTIADYAADARNWAAAARRRTGAPCAWLLGHSEGGLVALAAARQDAGICGLLLVSAPGRPLGMLLREQFRAGGAPDAVLTQAEAALAELEAGRRVDAAGLPPGFAALFDARVQPYLIDLLRYDPARLASAYQGPLLIVQGERDIQVLPADGAAFKAARPDATVATIPGMTHVLKATGATDRAGNIATYTNPDLPLAPGVADAIAGFVKAHPAHH